MRLSPSSSRKQTRKKVRKSHCTRKGRQSSDGHLLGLIIPPSQLQQARYTSLGYFQQRTSGRSIVSRTTLRCVSDAVRAQHSLQIDITEDKHPDFTLGTSTPNHHDVSPQFSSRPMLHHSVQSPLPTKCHQPLNLNETRRSTTTQSLLQPPRRLHSTYSAPVVLPKKDLDHPSHNTLQSEELITPKIATAEDRIIHMNTINSPRAFQLKHAVDLQNEGIFDHNRTITYLHKRLEHLRQMGQLPKHPTNLKIEIQDIINEVHEYYTARQKKISERLGCSVSEIPTHERGPAFIKELNTRAIARFREYTHRLVAQQAQSMSKNVETQQRVRDKLSNVPLSKLVDKVDNSIIHGKPVSLNNSESNDLNISSPQGRRLRRSDILPLTTNQEHVDWMIDDMRINAQERHSLTTLDAIQIGHLLASIDPSKDDIYAQVVAWRENAPSTGSPEKPTGLNYRELYPHRYILQGMRQAPNGGKCVQNFEKQLQLYPKRVSFAHLILARFPNSPQLRVKVFDAVTRVLPHQELTFREHMTSHINHQRSLWRPHLIKHASDVVSPTHLSSLNSSHPQQHQQQLPVSATQEQERFWIQESATRFERRFLSDHYLNDLFRNIRSLLLNEKAIVHATKSVLHSSTVAAITQDYGMWLYPRLLRGYIHVESARDILTDLYEAIFFGEQYVIQLFHAWNDKKQHELARIRVVHGGNEGPTKESSNALQQQEQQIMEAIVSYHTYLHEMNSDPFFSSSRNVRNVRSTPLNHSMMPFSDLLQDLGGNSNLSPDSSQTSQSSSSRKRNELQHEIDSIYSILSPAELMEVHSSSFYPELTTHYNRIHEKERSHAHNTSSTTLEFQTSLANKYELGLRITQKSSSSISPIADHTSDEGLSTLLASIATHKSTPPTLRQYTKDFAQFNSKQILKHSTRISRNIAGSNRDSDANTPETNIKHTSESDSDSDINDGDSDDGNDIDDALNYDPTTSSHKDKNSLFGNVIFTSFHPLGFRYAHLERDRLRLVMTDLRERKQRLSKQVQLLNTIIQAIGPADLKTQLINPVAPLIDGGKLKFSPHPHTSLLRTNDSEDRLFHPGTFLGDENESSAVVFYQRKESSMTMKKTTEKNTNQNSPEQSKNEQFPLLTALEDDFTDENTTKIYDNTYIKLTYETRNQLGYKSPHHVQRSSYLGDTMTYSTLSAALLFGNLPLAEALLLFGASPSTPSFNIYRRSALYFQYMNSHLFHSHLSISLSTRYYEKVTSTDSMLGTSHIQTWFDGSYFFRLKAMTYVFLRNLPQFQTIVSLLYTFPHAVYNLDNVSRQSVLHNLINSPNFSMDSSISTALLKRMAAKHRVHQQQQRLSTTIAEEVKTVGQETNPIPSTSKQSNQPSKQAQVKHMDFQKDNIFGITNVDGWASKVVDYLNLLRQVALYPNQIDYWKQLGKQFQQQEETRYQNEMKSSMKDDFPPRPPRPYASYHPMELALQSIDAFTEYYHTSKQHQLSRLKLRLARNTPVSLEETLFITPTRDRPLPTLKPPSVNCASLVSSYLNNFDLVPLDLGGFSLPPKNHVLYQPISQQSPKRDASHTSPSDVIADSVRTGMMRVQPQSESSLQILRHVVAISPALLFIRDVYGVTPFDNILKRSHNWDSFQLLLNAKSKSDPQSKPETHLKVGDYYQYHAHNIRAYSEIDNPSPPSWLRPSPFLHHYSSNNQGGKSDPTLVVDLDALDAEGSHDTFWLESQGKTHPALSHYHHQAFGGTSAAHFGGVNTGLSTIDDSVVGTAERTLQQWKEKNPDLVYINDHGEAIDMNPYPLNFHPKPMPNSLATTEIMNPIAYHMTWMRSRSIFANLFDNDDVEQFDNFHNQSTAEHTAKYLRRLMTNSPYNTFIREIAFRNRVKATLVDCQGYGPITSSDILPQASTSQSLLDFVQSIAKLPPTASVGTPSSSLTTPPSELGKTDYLLDLRNDSYRCLHDPYNTRQQGPATGIIPGASSSDISPNRGNITAAEHEDSSHFFLIDRQWGNHGHDLLTLTLRSAIYVGCDHDSKYANQLYNKIISQKQLPLPLSSLVLTTEDDYQHAAQLPLELVPSEALPTDEMKSQLQLTRHDEGSDTKPSQQLLNPINIPINSEHIQVNDDPNAPTIDVQRQHVIAQFPCLTTSHALQPAHLQEITARIASIINPRTIPLYTLYDHTFMTLILESQVLDPLTRFTLLFHPQVQNALFHVYHRRLPTVHASSPQQHAHPDPLNQSTNSTQVLEDMARRYSNNLVFIPYLRHLNSTNSNQTSFTESMIGSNDRERATAYIAVLEYVYSFARRSHPLQPPLHATMDFRTIPSHVGTSSNETKSPFPSDLAFFKTNETKSIQERVVSVQRHLHELMDLVDYFYASPESLDSSAGVKQGTGSEKSSEQKLSPYLLRMQEQERRKAKINSAGLGTSSSPTQSSGTKSTPQSPTKNSQSSVLSPPKTGTHQQQAEWRGLMSLLWAPPGSAIANATNFPNDDSDIHTSSGWRPFVDMVTGKCASHEFAFMPAVSPGHLAQLEVQTSMDLAISDDDSTIGDALNDMERSKKLMSNAKKSLTPDQLQMAYLFRDRLRSRSDYLQSNSSDAYLDWSDGNEYDDSELDTDFDDDIGINENSSAATKQPESQHTIALKETRRALRQQLREERLDLEQQLDSDGTSDSDELIEQSSHRETHTAPRMIPKDIPFLPFSFVFDDSPTLKTLSKTVSQDGSILTVAPSMSTDFIPLERLTDVEDIPLRFKRASLQTLQKEGNIDEDDSSISTDDSKHPHLSSKDPHTNDSARVYQAHVLSKYDIQDILNKTDEYSSFEKQSFLYGPPASHLLYENRFNRGLQHQIALREQYFNRVRLITQFDLNRQSPSLDRIMFSTKSLSSVSARTKPQRKQMNHVNRNFFQKMSSEESRKSMEKIFAQKTEFTPHDVQKYSYLLHGVEDSWLPSDLRPMGSKKTSGGTSGDHHTTEDQGDSMDSFEMMDVTRPRSAPVTVESVLRLQEERQQRADKAEQELSAIKSRTSGNNTAATQRGSSETTFKKPPMSSSTPAGGHQTHHQKSGPTKHRQRPISSLSSLNQHDTKL